MSAIFFLFLNIFFYPRVIFVWSLHMGELNIDSSATYTFRHHSRWLPAFSFNYDRVVISKHSIEVGFSVTQLQAITLHFSSETFQFIISLKCSTFSSIRNSIPQNSIQKSFLDTKLKFIILTFQAHTVYFV